MRQTHEIFYRKIPLPVKVKKPVLAVGSQTKNTLCLIKDNLAYLSAVHSDLSNPRDFLTFEKDIRYFLRKNPKIIAYDLHPEYQSTKYALNLRPTTYDLRPIQHHHAHIVSCMAENGLRNQKVIGVAFDGTGLGTDNTLWGAEFLVCDYKSFSRCAHLKEIPLLGAQKAILEPWRLAVIWLYQAHKDNFLNLKIDFVRGLQRKKWQILKKMYLANFNAPLTSSMGRLFDAVASLVLAKYKVNFEAELPIRLERLATQYNPGNKRTAPYAVRRTPYTILHAHKTIKIDPTVMFQEIVKDLKAGEPKDKIAYRFHLTVAQMIKRICLLLRRETKINKVVLSGGVFGNSLLLRLSLDLLYKEDFKVFTHRDLSCNDSSISLGQAIIAAVRSV